MAKLKTMIERDNGWCDEVAPVMDGYKMACCDCGLVHNMRFKVVRVTAQFEDGTWAYEDLDLEEEDEFRVIFQASRNNRSTGQVRRWRK